jgi:electron transport complex protein RnfC
MADEFHLMDCFECGSCSYVCPSHIPLVHQFRVAKGEVRKRAAAEAASRSESKTPAGAAS